MQQNLDRFKFRFYHFEDKKIYDVITFQKLPTEKFIRCFLTRPLPNGMSIDDVQEQLKIEERVEQNLILNQKSGIDGELMQSTGLKDKNGKLIFEGDVVQEKYENHLGNIEYDNHLVIFKNSCFQFAIQGDLDNLEIMCSMKEQEDKNLDVEIIGNIYEHNFLLDK